MCEYFVCIGVADNGKPSRFVHREGCKKLNKIEMPMRLGELHSKLHTLELAKSTFNDACFCPHCCIDSNFTSVVF
ncbi:hypothetical protein DEU29_11311 [Idiomarina aquatica]|uniref:Uncharacterized protein n=1 Tax=Idiomarina aquatica TaxID=1327752 RepID=A0A4V3CMR5_9GAMM|nr:hypothetical protein DEU29_11311 [Idiomarina aquatica]